MTQRRRRGRPPAHVRRQRALKQSHGSLDWVREQAHRQLDFDGWVREVFTDRIIVERGNGSLQERSWSVEDEELSLGDPVDVSLEYVAKSEGGPRLAGPIVCKDEARRLAYGAVLVPGEPDADGEVLSAEKVEQVAHEWLRTFRAIDVQHDVEQIEASPVESYIEPQDREVDIGDETITLPAGTWTMAVKVDDDAAWQQVTTGERSGFSIMGVPEEQLEAALAAAKSHGPALKRVTLADIGGGDPNGAWVAPFVSLVDQPAVPKAKFYALKASGSGAAGKAGRRFSSANADALRQMKETIDALVGQVDEDESGSGEAGKGKKMTKDEVQQLVDASVTTHLDTALQPLSDAVGKLAEAGEETGEAGKGDTGGTGSGAGGQEAADGEIPSAVKSALDKITERLETVASRTRATSRQPDEQAREAGAPATKSLAADYDAHGRRIKG